MTSSPIAEQDQPDCDRCGHWWASHQHFRVSMIDDCSVLDCYCHSYKRPPGRLVAWARRWLW